MCDRSTKAGAQAPATRPKPVVGVFMDPPAQRRPELKPRRHVEADGARYLRSITAQRSGRSSSPGDTHGVVPREIAHRHDAQRRPELKPRRHPLHVELCLPFGGRSTKAGAQAPATASCKSSSRLRCDVDAQRRPELKPRRHASSARVDGDPSEPCPLNEGRSSSPGDTCTLEACRPRYGDAQIGAQRRPELKPRRHSDPHGSQLIT